MGFPENLEKITGTDSYVNSGAAPIKELKQESIDFQAVMGSQDFFEIGARSMPVRLNMPANSVALPPHAHPGGEFAYVINGEYFDADLKGKPLHVYPRGSMVFYNRWSTHRPLSSEGAELLYLSFDGILFPGRPNDPMAPESGRNLAEKLVKLPTPHEAMEYALDFLVPEAKQRRVLLDVWESMNAYDDVRG